MLTNHKNMEELRNFNQLSERKLNKFKLDLPTAILKADVPASLPVSKRSLSEIKLRPIE